MYLDGTDFNKPYEGFDYGAVPYSGNDGIGQNPFPADLDIITGGNQTTPPNGWDRADPTGWARIVGNGGDWLELMVTTDHLDITGWTLYWENDDANAQGLEYGSNDIRDGIVGDSAAECGFVQRFGHRNPHGDWKR